MAKKQANRTNVTARTASSPRTTTTSPRPVRDETLDDKQVPEKQAKAEARTGRGNRTARDASEKTNQYEILTPRAIINGEELKPSKGYEYPIVPLTEGEAKSHQERGIALRQVKK